MGLNALKYYIKMHITQKGQKIAKNGKKWQKWQKIAKYQKLLNMVPN